MCGPLQLTTFFLAALSLSYQSHRNVPKSTQPSRPLWGRRNE